MKKMAPRTRLQDRKIMLLEDRNDEATQIVNEILKSMLGLVEHLVCLGFNRNTKSGFYKLKEELDSIKRIAANMGRAEMHAGGYRIANYAHYLFAFQQYFHSSYRARQGNVLEAVLKYFFDQYPDIKTFAKGKSQKAAIKKYLGFKTKLDTDVLAYKESQNKITLIQIRSTDVTGGTTAKGSLAQLLKNMLENKHQLKTDTKLDYVIYVWEELKSAQKNSLIAKIWDELKDVLKQKISKKKFFAEVENEIKCTNSINLHLIYGKSRLLEFLEDFTGGDNLSDRFEPILDKVAKWDDLWLSYALTSIELENFAVRGFSNFKVLEDKITKLGINITHDDLLDYANRSIEIAQEVQSQWTEETLPVQAPSDQINYIRDLILMKMIHLAITKYAYEKMSKNTKDYCTS